MERSPSSASHHSSQVGRSRATAGSDRPAALSLESPTTPKTFRRIGFDGRFLDGVQSVRNTRALSDHTFGFGSGGGGEGEGEGEGEGGGGGGGGGGGEFKYDGRYGSTPGDSRTRADAAASVFRRPWSAKNRRLFSSVRVRRRTRTPAHRNSAIAPTSGALLPLVQVAPKPVTDEPDSPVQVAAAANAAAVVRAGGDIVEPSEGSLDSSPFIEAAEALVLRLEQLPRSLKIGYAMPQIAVFSLSLLISVHATVFYESLGTSLSFIAFFTALGRSFDTVTDPLMASVTDQTRTRWGRRRPWMGFFCIPYALAFIAFMTPPKGLSSTGLGIWYGCFYVTFFAMDTITNVPYVALGPELTYDYHERSSLYFFGRLFASFGTLLGAVGPAVIDAMLHSQRWTFFILSVILGSIYAVSMLHLSVNVREVAYESGRLNPSQPPLVPSMRRAMNSAPFRPLVAGLILDLIAISALASMLPFYVLYVHKAANPTQVTSLALGALVLSGMLTMPMFLKLSQKYGKFKVWSAMNLANSLTTALFLLVPPEQDALVIAVAALNGMPIGASFLSDSILADVIDYDEMKTSDRSEGAFSVFAVFIPKLVSIPAQALPLALISAVGFVPSIDEKPQPQPDVVLWFIRTIFIILPSVCMFASFVIKHRFPIRTQDIARAIGLGIEAHARGQPCIDPLTGLSVPPRRTDLSMDETKVAQLREHLPEKWLNIVDASANGAHSIVIMLYRHMVGYACMAACSIASIATSFPFIDEDALAWIPATSAIVLGISVTLWCYTMLQRKAAIKLMERQHAGRPTTVDLDMPVAAKVDDTVTGVQADESSIRHRGLACRSPQINFNDADQGQFPLPGAVPDDVDDVKMHDPKPQR